MFYLLFFLFDLLIERKDDILSNRNIYIAIGIVLAFFALISGLVAFALLRKKKGQKNEK